MFTFKFILVLTKTFSGKPEYFYNLPSFYNLGYIRILPLHP